MTSQLLQQWMGHPALLNVETADALHHVIEQYPYFQTAHLLYLKNLYVLQDGRFADELRRGVPFVSDRTRLFQLTEGEHYALRCLQPKPVQPAEVADGDRTLALIDAFLADAPEEERKPQNIEGLDYTVDYTAYLLQEDEAGVEEETKAPQLRGHELIDDFIQKQAEAPSAAASFAGKSIATETAQPSAAVESEDSMDESCFTETLAKIYIKQHRYEKALEIIKKLSLNYPKKNAYFADQIRFLEKLIINANSK